jgi:DnaK suppressor protein
MKNQTPNKKVSEAKVTPIKSPKGGDKPAALALPKKAMPGPYNEIKVALVRQRQTILAEAGIILENTLNPTNEVFADWTDQASAETDQNFSLRLREREQHLLKKIDDAIERIKDETFGVCEVCGGPISIKRLKARPVTTLCIECKTRQEIEEKIRQ